MTEAQWKLCHKYKWT